MRSSLKWLIWQATTFRICGRATLARTVRLEVAHVRLHQPRDQHDRRVTAPNVNDRELVNQPAAQRIWNNPKKSSFVKRFAANLAPRGDTRRVGNHDQKVVANLARNLDAKRPPKNRSKFAVSRAAMLDDQSEMKKTAQNDVRLEGLLPVDRPRSRHRRRMMTTGTPSITAGLRMIHAMSMPRNEGQYQPGGEWSITLSTEI